MLDIEDISGLSEGTFSRNLQGSVAARYYKKRNLEDIDVTSLDLLLPEKQRVFVQTWGCAHNTSDSEYMAGLLSAYGYQVFLGGSSDNAEGTVSEKSCSTETTTSVCCGDGSCDTSSTVKVLIAAQNHHVQNCEKPSFQKKPSADRLAKEAADIWVLNSCTVKGPAEDHFRNAIMESKRLNKRLVVAGCVPQSRPATDYLKNVSVIGVQQIDRVVEVVEQTLAGNTVRFMEKRMASDEHSPVNPLGFQTESKPHRRRLAGAPLDLPKIRRNPLVEILAISTGCLNACTYCKTKHARGVLASYPLEELLQRASMAFGDGVKELWLTSEDLGAYGRDLPRRGNPLAYPALSVRWPDCLTLTDLLFNLLPLIPPGCMLRLGMTNPPYILDQLEEIAAVLRHPRVYSFIHIPVQSGSDAVLDVMRREYTIEEFFRVVDFLTTNVPPPPLPEPEANQTNGSSNLTVATDIICGFPTELEADFQQTLQLVQKYQFPVLHINQFFARPGTPAANMRRRATTAEVKQRTRQLHSLFRTYRPYEGRTGSLVRVLITESSHDGKHWVGHTKAYEQVLLAKDPDLWGHMVLVKITACDKFFMRGTVVDKGPFNSLIFPTSSMNSTMLSTKSLPLDVQKPDSTVVCHAVSVKQPSSRENIFTSFAENTWHQLFPLPDDKLSLITSICFLVLAYGLIAIVRHSSWIFWKS